MSLVDAYEVLIVGGGRPGQALAADLGSVGHRVAMIEQGMIGGTCINVGCIPTKTLAASAAVAELVSGAGQFGIRVDGWESDLASVLANKRAVVSGLPMVELGRVFRRLGNRVTIVQRTVEGSGFLKGIVDVCSDQDLASRCWVRRRARSRSSYTTTCSASCRSRRCVTPCAHTPRWP